MACYMHAYSSLSVFLVTHCCDIPIFESVYETIIVAERIKLHIPFHTCLSSRYRITILSCRTEETTSPRSSDWIYFVKVGLCCMHNTVIGGPRAWRRIVGMHNEYNPSSCSTCLVLARAVKRSQLLRILLSTRKRCAIFATRLISFI